MVEQMDFVLIPQLHTRSANGIAAFSLFFQPLNKDKK